MRIRLLVAAAATAATALTAPPASASSVCLENNQLTFSPPLTLSNQAGNVTIGYQGTCADLPGLTPSHYSGTVTVPYFGNCLAAIIAEGGQSVVIGGTLYLFVQTNRVKVEILVPNATCPIASAHGTGVRVTV